MSAFLVETSTKASVVVQIITGLVGAFGLNYTLDPEHSILTDLLRIELFVQFIELVFYISFLYSFNLQNLAIERYYDWLLSTPLMLFTMSAYFFYLSAQEKQKQEKIEIKDFILLHQNDLIKIGVANVGMLVFGFLGELGYISKAAAFTLGTASFGISFYTLYDKFARYSELGKQLYSIMLLLWSGYGLAFLFPTVTKNLAYNGLDILAKNFFGLFLSFQIVNLAVGKKIDSRVDR